ncbi:DUF1573 domain-containing protein [Pedobacter sp. HDW13]|uniref:DUF1573 domain-containing protein n=1 Tax=unclassified Pedobacter TaxID=2628915 RepID=UPI000F5A4960|nr:MULTISPECIES: DUF1573 domain-containing protein [unclassified Pedobacter]QIL41610.1 DUF1573 domain-containing protein [Pedobacter sp. HDW13]RQO64787.1 hypothetical protein DBR40_25085 [Pedobacter sp. KBW01]
MKNKFIYFALLSLIYYSCKPIRKPILNVNHLVYDFKSIGKQDSVAGEFLIRNSGNDDLIIENIAPSCSCTIIGFEKKAIPPGKSALVKFVYKPVPAYDTGKVLKEIVLQANTEERLYVLKIIGSVY